MCALQVGSEDRDSGTESDDEQPYDDPEPEPGMSPIAPPNFGSTQHV